MTLLLLSKANCVLLRSRTDYIVDTRQSACIAVKGSVRMPSHGAGEGYTWIDVSGLGRDYSCYITPNCNLEIFLEFIDDLTSSIRDKSTPGNRVRSAGSSALRQKGSTHARMAGSQNSGHNERRRNPTLHRASQTSHIYLTVSNVHSVQSVSDSQILVGEENLNDEYCIEIVVTAQNSQPQPAD